jgi:triosephosphate isomerase
MKTGIPPLIVGNWKMNPQTVSLSTKLGVEFKKKLSTISEVDVVIAPPSIYLESVHRARNSSKAFALGAQNVHFAQLGAFTGEVSIPMLKDLDVSHVIIGHSERRALGETDVLINEKILAVIKAGLVGIVCVGESKRDHAGHYLTHIEMQIRKALTKVSRTKLSQIVVAYEPLWAIGTGRNATAGDIYEMKIFIEKVISDLYGRNYAQKVRVLYGGSVNEKNAMELFVDGMMDGFLVGGASLHPDEFIHIVKAVRGK